MKKTVWVVEQGEYSDYRVVGVFSSQKHAKTIANALNADGSNEATVAEWPLDPVVDELRQGFSPYVVHMRYDGTVERCEKWEITSYELSGRVSLWRRTQAPAYRGLGIPDILTGTIWAKDEAHAIKIANEHRAQMIARGEWKADGA